MASIMLLRNLKNQPQKVCYKVKSSKFNKQKWYCQFFFKKIISELNKKSNLNKTRHTEVKKKLDKIPKKFKLKATKGLRKSLKKICIVNG